MRLSSRKKWHLHHGCRRHPTAERLTASPFETASDTDPNISPDGQTITFVRLEVEHELQALFVIDIDGTSPAETHPVQSWRWA